MTSAHFSQSMQVLTHFPVHLAALLSLHGKSCVPSEHLHSTLHLSHLVGSSHIDLHLKDNPLKDKSVYSAQVGAHGGQPDSHLPSTHFPPPSHCEDSNPAHALHSLIPDFGSVLHPKAHPLCVLPPPQTRHVLFTQVSHFFSSHSGLQ